MKAIMAEAPVLEQPSRLLRLAALAGLALLAACQTVVPRSAPPARPAPAPAAPSRPAAPQPAPALPEDQQRQRAAVLVPLTGANAAVGRSIADAASLAILDTGGRGVRITSYDTAGPGGAGAAAARALAEGHRLILGPLFSADVAAVAPVARAAGVPVVSFSNDATAGSAGVFLLGFDPEQSIERVVSHARAQGISRFAALIPAGTYGRRAADALLRATQAEGGQVTAMQTYDRSPASIAAAVKKLGPAGSYEAVLIADNGRISLQAAPLVRRAGGPNVRLLGTELWSADPRLGTAPALAGAWYATVPDRTYNQLDTRFRARFGRGSYRLASLGYDAVLLTVRIAGKWKEGAPFPLRELTDPDGFAGVDGAFRFRRAGIAERALEVQQAGPGGFTVVSPAPANFGG
jgi:branched-chain amino acid transport system substrate-binding protein